MKFWNLIVAVYLVVLIIWIMYYPELIMQYKGIIAFLLGVGITERIINIFKN